jgi:hypothetical protein
LKLFSSFSVQERSENVEKVELSIHNSSSCGGNSAYIELLQDSISCKTKDNGVFVKGDVLVWKDSTLGTCLGKEFDVLNDEIRFETKSNDLYCPKTLTITMNNGDEYKKEGMNINSWIGGRKNQLIQIAKSKYSMLSLKSE